MNNNREFENINSLNQLYLIDNIIDYKWFIYNEKKIILDYFTYIYDEFNKYIFEIGNKIHNINTEINYYELIYIKENINNYSDNILLNIKKLKEIIIEHNNSIIFYKIKNYMNYFTISNISNEIYELQEIINNSNKIKNRIIRWNSHNDINLFEDNLNNILSKCNN